MNTSVDNYLINGCGRCELGGTPECKVVPWRAHLELLRSIVNETELVEEVKWGVPCYTFQDSNLVNITALKNYCAVGFYKGVLLQDPEGILQKPGPNSRSARLLKFTEIEQITALEPTIKAYIEEAIAAEKAGLKVDFSKNAELPIPEELEAKFEEMPELEEAFFALTPGRQRGYLLHFSGAKQSKTRTSRIEKHTPNILIGKGLHDRYSC